MGKCLAFCVVIRNFAVEYPVKLVFSPRGNLKI